MSTARKAALAAELGRARNDVIQLIHEFTRLCCEGPRDRRFGDALDPSPKDLAEIADRMALAAGRVAGFGRLLAREVDG